MFDLFCFQTIGLFLIIINILEKFNMFLNFCNFQDLFSTLFYKISLYKIFVISTFVIFCIILNFVEILIKFNKIFCIYNIQYSFYINVYYLYYKRDMKF